HSEGARPREDVPAAVSGGRFYGAQWQNGDADVADRYHRYQSRGRGGHRSASQRGCVEAGAEGQRLQSVFGTDALVHQRPLEQTVCWPQARGNAAVLEHAHEGGDTRECRLSSSPRGGATALSELEALNFPSQFLNWLRVLQLTLPFCSL